MIGYGSQKKTCEVLELFLQKNWQINLTLTHWSSVQEIGGVSVVGIWCPGGSQRKKILEGWISYWEHRFYC